MTVPQINPVRLPIEDYQVGAYVQRIRDIISSGNLVLGAATNEFESLFAEFNNSAAAVSTNSGTSALEAMLLAVGVAGKRILVPTNTNFATAATVIRAGATPVFGGMRAESFNMSLEEVRRAEEAFGALDAIMLVHIGGIIDPDVPKMAAYATAKGMLVFEDCAHAHGSRLDGVCAGNFGIAGAYSFFATKVITTGEGGMVVTDSPALADALKSFRNQGKRQGAYLSVHEDFGSSWRITEMAAALGVIQLQNIDQTLGRRDWLTKRYAEICEAKGVPYCSAAHMDRASHYKFIIRMPSADDAATARAAFRGKGIICGGGVYDIPLHRQPVFASYAAGYPEAYADYLDATHRVCGLQLCPPVGSRYDDAEVERLLTSMQDIL